ncbi:MAG: hypothetical protein KDB53_18530, partial [Planctomycetes bacterium]|nr:hypothetical protein [Planctomycetota bacterium]
MPQDQRTFLRHTLAALAYRAAKVLRDAPVGMADLTVADGAMTGTQVVDHIADVVVWMGKLMRDDKSWGTKTSPDFAAARDRFFAALEDVDGLLASGEPIAAPVERLFQGPVADALTHVGQLATLRRRAGSPVQG